MKRAVSRFSYSHSHHQPLQRLRKRPPCSCEHGLSAWHSVYRAPKPSPAPLGGPGRKQGPAPSWRIQKRTNTTRPIRKGVERSLLATYPQVSDLYDERLPVLSQRARRRPSEAVARKAGQNCFSFLLGAYQATLSSGLSFPGAFCEKHVV